MGCGSNGGTRVADLDNDALTQKRIFLMKKEDNDFKIKQYRNEITNLDIKIKQGEADVKLNQYKYSQEELDSKISELISLKKDRDRIKASLDSLVAINENIKNNLHNLNNKIDERENIKAVREGMDIMNRIGKENHSDVIADNVALLKEQKEEQERLKRMLLSGNDQYLGGNTQSYEEEYRRKLLGTSKP
jgi:hypothetical protein